MNRLGGRFVLVREIGSGGMSRVFLGRDEVLDRPVAVKILDPELEETEVGPRFRREGRTAARLSHPNIVQVYDAGESGLDGREVSYIVMEYVPGGDLKGLMDRCGPLPWPMLSRIGSDVAAGLAHAHERGVIHRDVKPHNVLLDEYGSPKIADFGIARAFDAAGSTGAHSTSTGSYLGTASYSSPEQLRGERITPKSDVYSLGATLYHAAVGEPPFVGTPIEVASQQIERSPVPPRERGASVGTRFEALILGCLDKDPASRPDASNLHERLLQTGAAAAAGAEPLASNGPVGVLAAGVALRDVGNTRAAGAGLSRAAGAAKAASLAGLAGTRDVIGRRLDRRRGEKLDGPPERTVTVPTRTFQTQRHRRNLLAVLAGALVLLFLLVGGAWVLLSPGGEEAANPPGNPQADGGGREGGNGGAAKAEQGPQEEANNKPSGASGDARPKEPSGSTTVPPPAEAKKAVYDMYVDESYQRVDATWNALSERLQGEVGSPERWAEQEDLYTFTYMEYVSLPKATVSGDTARVDFEARLDHTWGSELHSGTWVCVVEDGKWKLDRLENETVQPA